MAYHPMLNYLLMILYFQLVHDINTSATELNIDLKEFNDCAFQWKISFIPDSSQQAQEIIFSRKLKMFPVLNLKSILGLSETLS